LEGLSALSKQIPLSRGLVAIVDDEDYLYLSRAKWCASKNSHSKGYFAMRKCKCPLDGKVHYIQMHRQILRPDRSQCVDHANHNTLDNRKENIRICTHSQNQMNRMVTSGKSKYKGVYWNKDRKKWIAAITVKVSSRRKRITLGAFQTEIEAAKTYDKAAIKYFGDFAYINIKPVNTDTLMVS